MKIVITDFRINNEEKNNLEKLSFIVLNAGQCDKLYNAVCGHPDMLIHIIDNKNIMVHKNMDKAIIEDLKRCGKTIILSQKELIGKYPHDICLNALNFNNFFIHNLKYTDELLLKYVSKKILLMSTKAIRNALPL